MFRVFDTFKGNNILQEYYVNIDFLKNDLFRKYKKINVVEYAKDRNPIQISDFLHSLTSYRILLENEGIEIGSSKDYCTIMLQEFEQSYKEIKGENIKVEEIRFDTAFPFFSIMLKPNPK